MPQTLLKPKALPAGGTIGLISPSRHVDEARIAKGVAELRKLGFKVKAHPQTTVTHHQLGGTGEARAKALLEMFEDPSIDAILCTRGGIGSYHLLPHLDFARIKAAPKILCGFSDITTLLTALYMKTGLVGFHGPMLWNFFTAHDARMPDEFAAMLQGSRREIAPGDTQSACLRPGSAEGRLLGGNMNLLEGLIGSQYALDAKDAILFIEDTEEPFSKMDRLLHHLHRAGLFENIRGLIVGELADMHEERFGAWGDDYRDLLQKWLPSRVPIVTNFPCGHGKMMTTLPMGVPARLNVAVGQTTLELLESPFQP